MDQVGDPEALERGPDLRAGVGDPVDLPVDSQELLDAQALGERQIAGGEAHLRHRLTPAPGQPAARDLDPSAVGRHDPEQHQQRRRLARPVGAQKPDALAPGPTGQVDSLTELMLKPSTRRGGILANRK
jgi:hypothetical protein